MAKSREVLSDQISFEITFFEGVLRHAPRFVGALSALAQAYTLTGEYHKGLLLDERLASLCPNDPVVFYNLACSLSLLYDLGRALEALKKAVALGYQDFKYLESDQDLMNLMTDDRFKEYYRTLKDSVA